jgi:adenine-specific DNA-methyltransferase
MRSRTETLRENKPGFWYPIYVSKDFKHITLQHKKGYYKVYPIAQNGKEATWINLPDTFNEKNMEGTFVAKMENKKVVIYRKFYEQQIFKNVWIDKKYQSEFHGTNLLKEILGKNIFEYPKSLYLIEDILKITSKKDSIILDFFAGSGTTGHAVLKLNKEDKGNRKFILCTNNENKIAEEVCYPRIKKVIEGHKDHPEITKMQENLKYFKTELLDVDHISHVSDEQKIKLTYQAGEMIALRENTFDEVEKNEWWQIFKNGKKYMAIYFKEDKSRLNELVKRLGKLKERVALYIFSWGKNEYKNEFTEHKSIRVEDIPEPIIDVYKEINRLS